MLCIGSRDALQVRRMRFAWGCGIRLLYASDLHLNRWTPHIVEQLIAACLYERPDGILLGGDLVDLPNGLPLLRQFIQAQSAPVWAIGGNHDALIGIQRVRHTVEAAGGHWLDDTVQLHPNLSISGHCQPTTCRNSILCTHDPAVFPEAARAGFRLILAGHLHGGQFIMTQRDGRLYPGAWFYRWNGDCFVNQLTTLLVSRGVNDTLPIRWNCPREVLLCCC